MDKPKPTKPGPKSAKPAAAAPTPPSPPPKVPPLFRKIDWLVLLICFGVIWAAYLLTLAPDLTLEDSGELCTASFYAGIPHPPGYPFWSLYSYLWTLLPFGSVTWRVEVGESFAAAIACGLVGFMVSRGSSMLIEGIQELNAISRKWENAICIICGVTAGLLLGFDDFMWKESVVINRISLFDVPWLMIVTLCILRWIYAPQQRRYLYIAMFIFGLCFTIHQTMLVASMGIEVAIAMAHPRYGRTFCLGNSIIYLCIVILKAGHVVPAFSGLDSTLVAMLHAVGILSIATYVWLAIYTKENLNELCRDGALAAIFLFLCAAPIEGGGCIFLSFVSLCAFGFWAWKTWQRDLGWLVVLICGFLWVLGVMFYFFEPISGMTDPPMQWGYPRTVEGFFHALSRGQYEKASPTNIAADPVRFIMQIGLLIHGVAQSFSWVSVFVALLPFLFLFKMQKRERTWIIGLAAIYFCFGIFLTMLMNTTPDRQATEENRVFFAASHAIVAILIGYGFAVLASYMATHYQKFRTIGLSMGLITILPAIVVLYDSVSNTFYGGAGSMGYIKILLLFLCMTAALVLTALSAQRYLKIKQTPAEATEDDRFFFKIFGIAAIVFLGFSAYLGFFGDRLGIGQVVSALPRIFNPHQYSLPVIGGLVVLFVVAGFVVALASYRERAPVAIILGLLLLMPVYSGLTHWAKSEERNHWFGYWFGHDMFTPPFVGPDGKFSYNSELRQQMMQGTNGDLIYPEMPRNTILFGGTDPGRFCPTYMIFCESFVPPSCKPMDPNFDRRDVYLITQNALADGTYLDYLRAQYFRSAQIDPPFFSELIKYVAGLAHAQGNGFVRDLASVAYHCLDVPLTKWGANVEAHRRAQGVYPPKEIYIPSPEDSERCFREYTEDVQRREAEGRLQPGEDVRVDPVTGKVSVSGQVAVMMINGLLCKVIFDHNPTNDFYVEESFPLEWMYPYEEPYGIIMKINRKPQQQLPGIVFKRDHKFWSDYSERLIGNWITYDTTVAEITNFVKTVYLDHNYSDFKGDLKFMRDEDAQKAFSKLRDSQAGMYAWRLRLLIPNLPTDPKYLAYRPKSDEEIQELYREADFAFKQSFAFCPYSPETVVRYVNFLFQFNRFDDALMVVKTAKKLDPYNAQYDDLIKQIENVQKQVAGQKSGIDQMENEARENPSNVQNLLQLGSAYFQMQQTDRAMEMFDRALTNPAISYGQAAGLANFYSKLGAPYLDKLESVLQRLTELAPSQPEAFYDLAALKAVRGETNEALTNLRKSMELNARRLKANPDAPDLEATNRVDARFDSLRSLPEYQKIVPPK